MHHPITSGPRAAAATAAAAALALAAAGCAAAPAAAPPPRAALLVVDTQLHQDLSYHGDFYGHTHRSARLYDGGRRLRQRLDGFRDAPRIALPPGRYFIVSEVSGMERVVEVRLDAGERRFVEFHELAAGEAFDG
jgi:hypothetical protein